MSELVVKVARAICGAGSDPDEMVAGSPMWTGWEAESRAAIAAVAEWLDEHEFYAERLCATHLRAALREQLEAQK